MLNLSINQNNFIQLSSKDSIKPIFKHLNQQPLFNDAVNDPELIIKDYVQHYQNLINTCDFKHVPKYGIQLAHSIARDVPNKYSITPSYRNC